MATETNALDHQLEKLMYEYYLCLVKETVGYWFEKSDKPAHLSEQI